MTNTQVPNSQAPAVRPRPGTPPAVAVRRSVRDRGTRLLAALFLAPTVVGIVVFTVVPIIVSVVLSLFHWNVIDPPASPAAPTTARPSRTRPSWSPSATRSSSWSSRSRCNC